MIYLHNMFVGAEADLLTPFIDQYLCMYCKTMYPRVNQVISRYMRFEKKTNPEPSGLLADPYSISIDKPQLPSTVLRRDMYPVLKSVVKNEDIIDLFEADTEEVNNKKIRIIKSMNVNNPKVISLLNACTPQGLIDKLIRKFESSRSVQLMIIRYGVSGARRELGETSRIYNHACTTAPNLLCITGVRISNRIRM